VTREEQKAIVLRQRAGHEVFRRLQQEADRRMTFADRIDAFDRIMSLAPYLPHAGSRRDDEQVTKTWIKVRQRHDATRR